MSRVEEMATLTRAIASSFDDRMAGLEALRHRVTEERQAVRDRLEATTAAREETATSMWQQLGADRQALRSLVGTMTDELARTRAARAEQQRESLSTVTKLRRGSVAGEMAGARVGREEMGASMRTRLGNERAGRSESVSDFIERSRRARIEMGADQGMALGKERARRARETRAFRAEVQALASALRDDREAATAELQERLATGGAERRAAVKQSMDGMRSERTTMAQNQARDLAGHRAGLRAEVNESIAGFHAAREALRANLAEFGLRWGELATLMRSKRISSSSTVVEGPPQQVEPLSSMVAPVARDIGEGIQDLPVHAAVSAEDDRLAQQVFVAVQSNREGIRLVDIESRFNLTRIETAQMLKRLMDGGKIRKVEKLYFATS